MYKKVDNLKFEDVRIIFRNFSGEATKYNRAGNRNFCVVIEDQAMASALIEEGWNVKTLRPRDEDEEPKYYLPVTVNFEYNPPSIYLLCGKKRTVLDESSISTLDHAEFKNVDLIVRPYSWEVNDKSGIKGYLKTMYVTIEEDALAKKYADFEEYEGDEDFPF